MTLGEFGNVKAHLQDFTGQAKRSTLSNASLCKYSQIVNEDTIF